MNAKIREAWKNIGLMFVITWLSGIAVFVGISQNHVQNFGFEDAPVPPSTVCHTEGLKGLDTTTGHIITCTNGHWN
jgi:hypothetical protein